MVRIDVQISFGLDLQIHHSMTGNLIQHMVEKTYPGCESGFAAAVEIDPDRNLRFQCIAGDFGFAPGKTV
jgi:hypothetical protein